MAELPPGIDAFHVHEVLHTLNVVQNIVANELEDHPAVEAFPDVSRAIEQVQEALGRAYQLVGAIGSQEW